MINGLVSIYKTIKIAAYVVSDAKENINVDLKFALPGKERQDSVYSGLKVWVLISVLVFLSLIMRRLKSPRYDVLVTRIVVSSSIMS